VFKSDNPGQAGGGVVTNTEEGQNITTYQNHYSTTLKQMFLFNYSDLGPRRHLPVRGHKDTGRFRIAGCQLTVNHIFQAKSALSKQ